MLQASEANCLIVAAGSVAVEELARTYKGLREVIWVTDEGSQHMDFADIPGVTTHTTKVWKQLVDVSITSSNIELPVSDAKSPPPNVLAFWQAEKHAKGHLVSYTQGNLVSAISAQLNALPASVRITPADLFLPADSLTSIYPLTLTMAALYYNASLALSSVAGPTTDLTLAAQGVAPTMMVASAYSVNELQKRTAGKLTSLFYQIVHWFQTRTLLQSGAMPRSTLFTSFNDSLRPSLGTSPTKLRLLFVAEPVNAEAPPLSPAVLSDLRIFTGARVIYALTAKEVAGAVSQTNVFDYRIEEVGKNRCSHFGSPVSSVEVVLLDTPTRKTTDEQAVGEVGSVVLQQVMNTR